MMTLEDYKAHFKALQAQYAKTYASDMDRRTKRIALAVIIKRSKKLTEYTKSAGIAAECLAWTKGQR